MLMRISLTEVGSVITNGYIIEYAKKNISKDTLLCMGKRIWGNIWLFQEKA